MIKHIQDAISYGLYEDFRAEDSTLVTGFHECFGEQLDCAEAFSSWPDENEAGVLHLALGEGKQFKISIEEEQTRQLDITPVESEIAKMSHISKAGEAKDFYNVHDTITIDGIEFEIVGIGHDIDALTGRNNTITLRQVDHLKKSRINPGPCPDGFTASELDKSFIESPQSWIPASILPYVRTVSKTYVTYNGIIDVMWRKLWVFSESEMFGSGIYSPAEEGERYVAFATGKDRIAYDENGSACYVWLRSSRAGNSGIFCLVNSSGGSGIDYAGYSRGVPLGFCI